MPVARSEPPDTRVIAHVDLDCFYVQVEQRRHPELKGKPTAVVMYNPWKGGGIIAVGYEARAAGVSRSMRGDDARKVCRDINLIQVPTHFGKADLTDYRDAGSEVVAVFSRGGVCERASIDEVYLDVTEAAVARLQQSPPDVEANLSPEVLGTHIIGLQEDPDEKMEVKDWLCRSALFASRSDQLLACGAMIIAELRTAVLEETGFTTSAGIAHNKMLAKLASGMHKPAQQTLIPSSGAPGLLASLPVKKLKGLGGKLGKAVESDLGIQKIGDLLPYSESKLQDLYGTNTGTWLWRVARGMSGDGVEGRTLPKSHGCGKTFPGPRALKDLDSVAYWLSELAGELQERLDVDLQQNNRSARLLVCHAASHLERNGENAGKSFPSKSCAIRYGKEKIAHDALLLFKRALGEFCPPASNLSPAKGETASLGRRWGVTALSLSANNIIDSSGTAPITQYFTAPASTTQASTASDLGDTTTPPSSPSSFSPSPEWDNSHPEDQGATTSTQMETLSSRNPPVKNMDAVVGSGPPSNSNNSNFLSASNSANQTFEAENSIRGNANLLNPDDDLRPAQSWLESAGNGAVGAEDREAEPLCTPKFGAPSISPARRCLALLELPPEDLSSAPLAVQGDQGRAFPTPSCTNSETVAGAEVITCSPLELGQAPASEPGARHPVEVSENGNSTSRETSSNGAISPSPQSATLSMSKPVSGSSKRLVFQRVDDLWGKSRPATQPLPSARQSGSGSWEYKEGEIDESVLSELPEDIQQELRKQLRHKRLKTGGRSTISDFFKTNSSTPK